MALCGAGTAPSSHSTRLVRARGGGSGTLPQSINEDGLVAGYYSDSSGRRHGFARLADGTITPLDPQGSIGTVVQSINRTGEITGNCVIDDTAHGFLGRTEGSFAIFDSPGSTNTAPILWATTQTRAMCSTVFCAATTALSSLLKLRAPAHAAAPAHFL